MRQILLVVLMVFSSAALAAEQPRPPWLDTDVLKAALAMELTDEQKPQFQQAVSDLVNGRGKATAKLLRRNNVTNLERKLKTANNRQFKKMDKNVAGFLSDDQYPRYVVYRDLLKQKMKEAGLRGGSGSDAVVESARTAILGNTTSH